MPNYYQGDIDTALQRIYNYQTPLDIEITLIAVMLNIDIIIQHDEQKRIC